MGLGPPPGASALDPVLAEIAEEITGRLQAGEDVDVSSFIRRHPKLEQVIRDLEPLLRGMAEIAAQPVAGTGQDSELRREGRILDDFRILREIGRGGMGIVYEAHQISLGRRVALKVLPLAAAMDPRALKRFEIEAQVAALLQHPRIVPVYAVGSIGDVPFYVMQFIDGASLAELVQAIRRLNGQGESDRSIRQVPEAAEHLARQLLSGRLADPDGEVTESRVGDSGLINNNGPSSSDSPTGGIPGRAYFRMVAQLGVQAAEALHWAHGQAVVHRDVKPANLLLDRQGTLWVTDFGLARLSGDEGLTLSGDMMGTLRYMSPEQAEGTPSLVDRRTDVYALGATLYELLALRPAVPGGGRQEVLRRIVEEDPIPIRRLNPAVPVDLGMVVAKAMSKDPTGRYETAQEFSEDLKRFLDGRPITARPAGPLERLWRSCRRRPVLASLLGALAASLVAGVAGVTWSWREAIRQKDMLAVANAALSASNDRERAAREQAQLHFDLARDAIEQYYRNLTEEILFERPQMAALRSRLFATALSFYRRLGSSLEAAADAPGSRADLAAVSRRIGEIAIDAGEREGGLEAFARACSLLEDLVRESPTSEGLRAELAASLGELGKLQLYTSGREAEGRRSLERALAIDEDLLSGRPDSDLHQLAVAEIAGTLGFERARSGEVGLGLRALERECSVLEQLVAEHPAGLKYRSKLALAFGDQGRILAYSGQIEKAVASLLRAAQLSEALTMEVPESQVFRRLFGQSMTDLARAHCNAGDQSEALRFVGRSLATLEPLKRTSPSLPSFHRALAEAYDVEGACLRKMGHRERALGSLGRARKLLDRLNDLSPDFLPYQSDLAENALLSGAVHLEQGRFLAAREELLRARDLLWKLPADAESLFSLARAESFLVRLTRGGAQEAQADRAVAALRRAIDFGYHLPESLRREPAFDPLRARPDFRLAEFTAAFPAHPFAPEARTTNRGGVSRPSRGLP